MYSYIPRPAKISNHQHCATVCNADIFWRDGLRDAHGSQPESPSPAGTEKMGQCWIFNEKNKQNQEYFGRKSFNFTGNKRIKKELSVLLIRSHNHIIQFYSHVSWTVLRKRENVDKNRFFFSFFKKWRKKRGVFV